MGAGTMPVYCAIRATSAFVKEDCALDQDIRKVCDSIAGHKIPVLN
jgi:hypothetical protein